MSTEPKRLRGEVQPAWKTTLLAAAVAALAACPPALFSVPPEAAASDVVPTADFAAEIDFFRVESDIVTSVSRHPESLWTSPAAVYTITGDEIRKAGAQSLVDALRMVPGLDVAAVDRNFYAVSARGLNNTFADKMLVLLDGRPIYTQLFGGTLWHQWRTFLPDIERIEVIRGPGGTLWGSNAVNGVINIITKSSEDTRGLLLRVAGGSNYHGAAELRWGGRSGYFNHRLWARFDTDEGYGGRGGDKVADDNQEVRAGYRLDWDLGDGLVVRASTEFSDGRIGNEAREVGSGRILFPGPKHETQLVTGVVRLEKDFAGGSSAHLQVAGDYIARETPFLGVTPGKGSFRSYRRTWEVELQHSLRLWRRHRLTWGGQLRHTNIDVGTGIVSIPVDASNDVLNVYGLFAEDEIELPRSTKLTLGTKVENNTFTGTNLQPSARLVHAFGEETVVWGAVSRAINTPSFGDRHVEIVFPPDTTSTPGMTIIPVFLADGSAGDTELLAYELGLRRRLGTGLSLDLAAFYNDYDGIVTFSGKTTRTVPLDPTTLRAETFLDNFTDAYAYGVEASLDFVGDERLRGELNGTWQHLRMRGIHNPSSPEWKANLRVEIEPLRSLLLVPTVHFVDHMNLPSIFGPSVPGQSIDSYFRFDLALHWTPAAGWPTVSIIGQNLNQRSHVEFSEPLVRGQAPVTRAWFVRLEYEQ